MLSALSVAELWRNEAARLAARSRLRASCRCRSTESRERSFTGTPRPREGFFGMGGGTFFSSCQEKARGAELGGGGPLQHPDSRPALPIPAPRGIEFPWIAPGIGPETRCCRCTCFHKVKAGQSP